MNIFYIVHRKQLIIGIKVKEVFKMHSIMPYFYGFDVISIILLLAGVVIAGVAQAKVRSAYNTYSQLPSDKGFTAAVVTREILRQNGIGEIQVEMGQGTLSDHYNPRTKTISLSSGVYNSASVAALAVAAHETGHAIQQRERYFFLSFKLFLAPVASFASSMAFPVILLGMIMSLPVLIDIGVYAFAAVLLFQLITLPVEYDASKRALHLLLDTGAITYEETGGVKKMLNAAALTYVAATIVTFLNLLRLLLLSRRRQ